MRNMHVANIVRYCKCTREPLWEEFVKLCEISVHARRVALFEDLLAALGCFQSQLWPKRSPACAKRQPWQHLPMIRAPGARSDSNLGQVEVLPWTFEGNHDCYSKCSNCYSYKALDAPVMTYDYSVQWCPKTFWQTNLQKIASGPYFDYFDGEPAGRKSRSGVQ